MSEKLSVILEAQMSRDVRELSSNNFWTWAEDAAKLEAEVARLQTLEALVTEAGRVEFRNNLPGKYPLAVWPPGQENAHPMTWGATRDMMNERGGRVTPGMIGYALKQLREVTAEEETQEETSCEK